MKMKKLCAALLAMSFAVGVGTGMDVQAASRSEIGEIQVNAKGSNFQYWNEDSASFVTLSVTVSAPSFTKNQAYQTSVTQVVVSDCYPE